MCGSFRPKERRAYDSWWRARMLDEHRSSGRYGELIGHAMRVGMPADPAELGSVRAGAVEP
jgi:hypothetical protein